MTQEHLPVWATANNGDTQVLPSNTINWVQMLNDARCRPRTIITIFPDEVTAAG